MGQKPLIIASATRQPSKGAFLNQTWLGKSLTKLRNLGDFEIVICPSSTAGLSVFYNRVLNDFPQSPIVFMHDDLAVMDTFFFEKLAVALEEFDVVGLCGCRTPHTEAPTAWFNETHNPSGQIGTSCRETEASVLQCNLASFGPAPQRVAATDGVFLAVRAGCPLRFDERFTYHHYDVDFTLRADKMGYKCGTWPIFAVHVSTAGTGYQSREWRESMELFANKWEDPEFHKTLKSNG